MKVFEIEIYDSFFNQRMSGEFEGKTMAQAKKAAREFYAYELDTEPKEIEIVSIKEIK